MPKTIEGLTLRALITDNLQTDLGRYLRKVAQATVLGVALSACSTSHGGDDAGMDDADVLMPDTSIADTGPRFDDFCETYDFDYFDSLDVATEPFAALIGHESYPTGFDAWVSYQLIAQRGEACATASDPTACEAALRAIPEETRAHALILGGGDDGFEVITGADEVLALMGGEVTTLGGAALIAHMHGYRVRCVAPSMDAPGGFDVLGLVTMPGGTCETNVQQARLNVTADGVVSVEESVSSTQITCPVGRRPAGLAPAARAPKTTPVAELFAEITRLEASAVAAFDVMVDELEQLGAPAELIAAAESARRDEVRHTEMMGELCRAYGAEPAAPEIAAPQRRTPFEIALENAVEGCVRETYGALVAAHQALKALDPRVASAMEEIAADEIRHAELSWALAAWLEPRLTDGERARIAAAKRLAIVELGEVASEALDESIIRLAGMPDPASHAVMVAQLAKDIWA